MKKDKADQEQIENLYKQIDAGELHFFDEAEVYQQLSRCGLTQSDIGLRIGKSQSAVANMMRILRLSATCKKLIKDNNLTCRHARELLKIPNEADRLNALKHIAMKRLSTSQSEKYILTDVPLEPLPDKLMSFISTVKFDVNMFKRRGLRIVAQKKDQGEFIDIRIRVYNQGGVQSEA